VELPLSVPDRGRLEFVNVSVDDVDSGEVVVGIVVLSVPERGRFEFVKVSVDGVGGLPELTVGGPPESSVLKEAPVPVEVPYMTVLMLEDSELLGCSPFRRSLLFVKVPVAVEGGVATPDSITIVSPLVPIGVPEMIVMMDSPPFPLPLPDPPVAPEM